MRNLHLAVRRKIAKVSVERALVRSEVARRRSQWRFAHPAKDGDEGTRRRIRAGERKATVFGSVTHHSHPNLAKVADRGGFHGTVLRPLNDRDNQGGQEADDANHHKKLDYGKSCTKAKRARRLRREGNSWSTHGRADHSKNQSQVGNGKAAPASGHRSA